MKTNKLYGFIVATVIALLAISTVMAGTLSANFGTIEANDVVLSSGTTLAGTAGDTLPVTVRFTATSDLQDLRVKVSAEGFKSDVSASTARFDVINGSTYVKKLSLALPSVSEMDDLSEGFTLYVSVADAQNEIVNSYQIKLERDSYSLNVLSVDLPSKASAGEIIALDVVLKNTGSREAQDTFVTASIPELDIAKKAYFGDLQSQDNLDQNTNSVDARQGRIYLVIPANVKTGDYSVDIKATNYDTTSSVRKVISITGMTNATNSTATVITAASGDNKEGIPTSIIVLTVVLVIIFVVLLVVLIVLLTKKPSERMEDFGETSYY